MSGLLLSELELRSLINTITISFLVSLTSLLIGFLLAFGFFYIPLNGKNIFRWLLFIPILIPAYLHAFSWMHLLMFLGDLKFFGLDPSTGVNLISSVSGVIGILTIAYFPIVFFLIHNGLTNISRSFIESALMTSDPLRTIRWIVIPMLFPVLLFSGLLVFVMTFITFDVPAFLGVNVFATQIFRSFTFNNEIARIIYLSLIPILLSSIIGLILSRVLLKNRPFFNIRTELKSQHSPLKPSGPLTLFFSIFVILTIFFTVLLPLGMLQIKNILAEKVPYNVGSSSETLFNTLMIVLVASTFIVILTFVIFYIFKTNSFVRMFFLLTFAFPPVTFGIIFIYLFNRSALNLIYSTPLILLIAYFFRFAPVAYELFYSREKSLNPQLLAASTLINTSFLKRFGQIYLPLFLPTIFLAWMLIYWLVAAELPITLLIQPAGFQTIITRLFIVLHYGAVELMSQMTTSLILISLLPILGVYLFLKLNKNE